MNEAERNGRALRYIADVRKRRRARAARVLLVIEIALVVYSVVMAVAIWRGTV